MQQHRTALTNPYNLHAVQIADLVVKPYTSNGAIFTSISSFWIHIQHAGSIFMHVILFLVAYIANLDLVGLAALTNNFYCSLPSASYF